MKRLFCFLTLALAFLGNAMAYDRVIVERHSFRINFPEDANFNGYQINWDGAYIKSITQTNQWSNCDHGQPVTAENTYYSYLDHQYRFFVQPSDKWEIGKNDRPNLGLGLVNNSGGNLGFQICNLKAGDVVRFEYYRKASGGDFPTYKAASSSAARQFNGGEIVSLADGAAIRGTDDIFIDADGNLDLNIPDQVLIRQITITLAQYKKAEYKLEQVAGTPGWSYKLTGSGVLEEKRGAVPYMTMRFGHDDDMTIVRDLGDGNYAASCIVDPSHDLNIEHDNVKLSANYKHRYQNKNKNYVAYDTYASGSQYNSSYNQYDEWGTSDENVKQLAQDEVNSLYGREWTVFQCDTKWNSDHDWSGRNGTSGSKSRCYKWEDDFATIWPLYGTYFYFFPEVKGKLSVKFYCEGAHQHMPFWWKAQDDGSGELIIKDQFVTGNENGNGYIYEYKDIEVVKGGAYYLCANPTLVSREHPVVRLISYEFIPEFRVEPLYQVVKTNTRNLEQACTIKGGPFNDLTVDKNREIQINGESAPEVKFEGNIADADFSITGSGSEQYLNISNITYKDEAGINNDKNHGGAIIVNLHCNAGKATFVLTVAYEAAPATMEDGSREATTDKLVKKWNFFKDELAVGQYKNGSGTYPSTDWTNSSTLYKEVNKFDGMTADWTIDNLDYTDENNPREPIFKSVYDMEGDNADMLKETEGLVFLTESNLLGIYNENETSTSEFQDRYIGLMGESKYTIDEKPRKLIIPYLTEGDRIVIKMGSYGNADDNVTPEPATLRIKGAKDAIGTTIPESADYVIGGSVPGVEDPSKPYGEYHFISAGGHFELNAYDAKLLKIYSIEIYRNAANDNADILTENSITTADGPELLFTDEDVTGTTKDMEFYLRYSGFEEPKTFGEFDNSYTRGNLKLNASSFTAGSKENSLKVEFTKGDFGSFRADAQVKTKDAGNTYVTDYTPGSLAVGNLDKMEYPYTWDFTDLLEINHPGNMPDNKYIDHAIQFERTSGLVDDYKGWVDDEGVHCLRNAPMNEPGILFANGGQLYAKNEMFNEIAGIGFKRSMDDPEDAKLMNRSVGIHSGSLELNADEGMFHKLVLPKVPANGVVYVRATPIKNASLVTKCSVDGVIEKTFDKTIEIPMGDNKKDYVYIMKNNAEQDVELWLNGLSVQKIAVSTDFKKIGSTGYATESRDHIIDHTLTEFFTGLPIKAYYGKLSDDKKSVSLEKVEFLKAATAEGDATGCILHNETSGTSKAVNIIDGGFHLFVPDMHDNGSNNIDGNVLLAHLGSDNIQNTSDVTRYVLANQWYSPTTGEALNTDPTVVRFVKVDHENGAKLSANSAYMELSKEAGAKIASIMLFYDESEEPSGEATGIVTVNHENDKDGIWYNLSGLPIDAPCKAGIYIRNGKKVVVK